MCFELKTPKLAILEGSGVALGFGGGGHHKRSISYPPLFLVDLGNFGLDLDLDLNGGERKLDPDLDLLI